MTSQLDGPSSPASPASSTSPASMTSTPDPDAYDIVATQGAYLFDPPRTPVWGFGHYNADFAAELEFGLKLAIRVQRWRRNQYHEAADEWLPGHTPPEVREKRRAEVEWLCRDWDQTSDSSSNENDDNGASNKAVARKKTMAASDRLRKPLSQAESFPTPPPSTQIPPTTRTRKRRRISDNDVADGRERKRPITRRAGFTAQLPAEGNTAPKTSPQKSRKRQPAHDADDKDECDKKLPKKARLANDVDPTGSRGEWLRRLRPRRPVR
ncbi:hypothetical protein F5Y10DRAFT_126429 [Nemania abortiva]|nr:hypothetical protein F5Y10DRAFT_126429 [Nemania abortiva]